MTSTCTVQLSSKLPRVIFRYCNILSYIFNFHSSCSSPKTWPLAQHKSLQERNTHWTMIQQWRHPHSRHAGTYSPSLILSQEYNAGLCFVFCVELFFLINYLLWRTLFIVVTNCTSVQVGDSLSPNQIVVVSQSGICHCDAERKSLQNTSRTNLNVSSGTFSEAKWT